MIPYWYMFLIPAMIALAERSVVTRNVDGTVRGSIDVSWVGLGVVITLLIGFRFEVGGDWGSYLRQFNFMKGQSYTYALSNSEFSHWSINKLMFNLDLGLTGVNLAYGFIFSCGLIAFARVQPRPWLVIACAVPYLIIVVAMGYSRQSVALGFTLIGIVALRQGKFVRFSFWVLVGASFHNSAALLLPLAGLAVYNNRLQAIAAIGLLSIVGYELLLADKIIHFIDVYVERQSTISQGALIRLSMNGIAAITFLYYRRMLTLTSTELRLWTFTSFMAIAMLIAYFLTELSTALDRMALYLIPLQFVIAAHLPDVLGYTGRKNSIGVFVVLAVFFMVQFVWLNFATHSNYWLPYKMGIAQ